ncbi:MAG: hypothetical protein ACKVQB_07755 [Bacteroidia bacterium]
MKKFIALFVFILAFGQIVNAQDSSPKKEKRVKTTWTGNGFFHVGFRPGSWEVNNFAAVTESGTTYKSGAKASNTPIYLSVEQITRFVYWNMDLSMMLGKKKYQFTQNQTKSFFNDELTNNKYQTVQASFLGAVGYLKYGRYGGYLGYRIAYDNNLINFNTGTYIGSFGGQKQGFNFHFFMPIRKSMFRMSFYFDNMKNDEAKFKAKTKESEYNLYVPFNKSKSSGLMLRYSKMKYSTPDYHSGLKGLNGGTDLKYNRNYFQIGFIIPIFKDLAPDDCVDCSGKGYNVAAGEKCTTCGGSGGKTCGNCNGQGLIVTDVTKKCAYCRGTGKVNCSTCAGLGTLELLKKNRCDVCHGTGKKVKK